MEMLWAGVVVIDDDQMCLGLSAHVIHGYSFNFAVSHVVSAKIISENHIQVDKRKKIQHFGAKI